MLRHLAAAAVALGMVLATTGPVQASTVRIVGNATDVELTAPLGAFDIAPTPFGTARAVETHPAPTVRFPITGGTLDLHTGTALVEHDGSGVALTRGRDTAFIGNLLIDTGKGTVFGDLATFGGASAREVPLFTLAAAEARGIPLLFTDVAGEALTNYFSVPDLGGTLAGYARPDIAPIPLPAAAWLMLGAVAALGVASRRRRAPA